MAGCAFFGGGGRGVGRSIVKGKGRANEKFPEVGIFAVINIGSKENKMI